MAAIVILMSLFSCSEKEDNKKTSTRPANSQFRPVDGTTANNQNNTVAVQSVNRYSSNDGYQNTLQLETEVTINNETRTIVTVHTPGSYTSSSAQGTIGGYQITAFGYCADEECSAYYMMIEANANGNLLYQFGFLRDFNYNNDLYKIQTGSKISFDQMINILYNAY